MSLNLFKRIVLGLVVRVLRNSPNRDSHRVGYIFDYITAKSMLFGRYEDDELTLLETRVFPRMARRSVCLDVGANIGNHALAFADWFAHVHAFEPHPVTARVLQINAASRPNIRCHAFGASSRDHFAQAREAPGNMGAARIVDPAPGAHQAPVAPDARATSDAMLVGFPCKRLDAYLDAALREAVDFVKIDVEGHELEALRGMEQILRQARPVIAFELLTGGASGEVDYLKSLGYAHFYEIRRTLSGRKELRRIDRFGSRKHKLLLASVDAPDW